MGCGEGASARDAPDFPCPSSVGCSPMEDGMSTPPDLGCPRPAAPSGRVLVPSQISRASSGRENTESQALDQLGPVARS